MSIVNGTGVPRLEVTKTTGVTITIEFPKVPQAGSGEDPNEQETVHDAFDHEAVVDKHGFKPRWTLDYSGGIDGVFLLALRHLLERAVEKIVLVPHIDMPQRKFEVRLISFGIVQRSGDLSTGHHEGVKLVFESTKMLDAIPFPQASLSGKRWQDLGVSEDWEDHTANVWHFFL